MLVLTDSLRMRRAGETVIVTGKDVVWQGETFHWSKHHEFLRFITLPSYAPLPLELALGSIDIEDMAQLRYHGWSVVPSFGVSDPDAYHDYIQASLGEFTVAKDQNVRLRSGWFSDRSVCYLAAGRPVVTQDTGFGNIIPTGEGLFAFNTIDDILAAFETIKTDYERHSRAAQSIAEAYFSAESVLAKVVDVVHDS